MNHWAGSLVVPVISCWMHGTTHDFMKEMSAAMRMSYTGAFKLMHLLEILKTRAEGNMG